MTNPGCQNRKRTGDCTERNLPSERLCDVCRAQMSDAEIRERDIALMAAKMRAQSKNAKPGCLNIRKTDPRNCIEKKLICLCAGCIAGMNDRRLWQYAAAIWDQREESRIYWQQEAEAAEYAAELRARGITGIDAEYLHLPDAPYVTSGLFHYSRPCWQHDATAGQEVAA